MSNLVEPGKNTVPGTEPPIREFVVREPDPKRVKVEEPKRVSLKWLWWLLGLVILGLLAWWLFRSCSNRDATCEAVPDSIFTSAAQHTALQTVEQWIPRISTDFGVEATAALRQLCDNRLSREAGINVAQLPVQTAFQAFAPNLEANVVTNIENLVAGHTFCRCR
jgi:hypothetical protein